jgi:hypothetical protein
MKVLALAKNVLSTFFSPVLYAFSSYPVLCLLSCGLLSVFFASFVAPCFFSGFVFEIGELVGSALKGTWLCGLFYFMTKSLFLLCSRRLGLC